MTYKISKWSLAPLYSGYDSPELQNSFDMIEEQVSSFEGVRGKLTPDEVKKIKAELKGLAEEVFEKRNGRGGCVRVSRKHSYTVTERNAEMALETQPDFHKTILFDWPFLLRSPCSGSKARGKAS